MVHLFPIILAVVLAQAPDSAISGVVRDLTGMAAPGVTVTVIDTATAAATVAVTDADGVYRVSPVRPGRYRIEASLDGFETAAASVTVDRGRSPAVDFTLTPAHLNEGVGNFCTAAYSF